MNTLQIVGAIFISLVIGFVGFYSGKKVKDANDFTTASSKGGLLLVVGISLATLIGGATTVGTTQTAYNYGLAGMWYTLGSSGGFLIMGLVLEKKIRNSGHQTMTAMISDEFGVTSELISSIMLYLCMAISLASQMVSSHAVLSSIIPSLANYYGLILCFILTILCVIYGGSLSAGNAGKLKTLLITIVSIVGGITVLNILDFDLLSRSVDTKSYFSLFSRGVGYELGNGLATVFGICCSQANVLALLSAKDSKTARNGMITCAILMPLIGLGAVMIGMFMRVNHPEISATLAFSEFLKLYFSPLLSGMALGTLFITLILSAAGTVLGCSTVLVKSVIKPLCKDRFDLHELNALRLSMFVTLLLATIAGSGIFGDSVLSFAFLSMSLRCVTLVLPFIMAVYFKGKADKKWVILSMILGPISVIFFGITKIIPIDELYIGMLIVIICCIIAIFTKNKRSSAL